MTDKPVTASVHITAPPERVYEYFVRPEAIVSWMGERALLEARPGGRFHLDIKGALVRGRYLHLDPPHRLLISWGCAGSDRLPPDPAPSRSGSSLTAAVPVSSLSTETCHSRNDSGTPSAGSTTWPVSSPQRPVVTPAQIPACARPPHASERPLAVDGQGWPRVARRRREDCEGVTGTPHSHGCTGPQRACGQRSLVSRRRACRNVRCGR